MARLSIIPPTAAKPAALPNPASGCNAPKVVPRAFSEDELKLGRRTALLVSLGVFLGSDQSTATAATSDAYYAELKANTKGLDSADLMSRYSSLGARGGKGAKQGKGMPSKNVAKNAEVLGLKPSKSNAKALKPASNAPKPVSKTAAKTSGKVASASASAASFNPVEVGLGLLALAGAGAIGTRRSSKSSPKQSSSPKKMTTPVRKAAPPSSKKATSQVPKKVAPPPPSKKTTPVGTQKLRPGTKPVQAPKTKRIGTVAKGAPAEKKSGGGATGAAVGVLALAGAVVVLNGGSQKEGKQAAPPKEPAPVEKKAKTMTAPVPPDTLATAPSIEVEKTQALIVKVEEKKPESAKPPQSKLPPTTGNSPAVLVGGSLVALVAAAAVGGSGEGSDIPSSSQSTSAAASGGSPSDDATARAKEARAWIDSWRAKQ